MLGEGGWRAERGSAVGTITKKKGEFSERENKVLERGFPYVTAQKKGGGQFQTKIEHYNSDPTLQVRSLTPCFWIVLDAAQRLKQQQPH